MAREKRKSMRLLLVGRVAEETSGMPSSWAQCIWTPRAGTAPGCPGYGDCLRASTPKAFFRRMLGGGAVGGAHHPCVTVPPPGNAVVTMTQGRIKGSSLLILLPELAWG